MDASRVFGSRLRQPSPWVFLHGRKSGEDRAIPLNTFGVAAARLFQQTNAYGLYIAASVRTAFICACQRAGIEDSITLVDGTQASGRRRWRVTPYVLRHTTLTELRRQGADLDDVRAWAGHKKIDTTRRYSPVINDKLIALAKRIDRPVKS